MKKPNEMDLPVPHEVYTKDYFLYQRHGADEFQRSHGSELSPLHKRLLDRTRPAPGRRILDVGCGCGELVIQASLKGAEAVGIDYSEAALDLARKAAEYNGVSPTFILGDVSELPQGSFDAIILADVVEHLRQTQVDNLYAEIRNRLEPGGLLVIHTWPNRYHTTYTYPLVRLLFGLVGRKKPKSPRKPHDEIMHVNEQTVFSLRRDLRKAGFSSPRVWLEHPIPPGAGFFYRFAHSAPIIRLFFADHILALAEVS